MKEKNIRHDIIESSMSSLAIDDLLKIYKKSLVLNKNIKKDFGLDVIAIYKMKWLPYVFLNILYFYL